MIKQSLKIKISFIAGLKEIVLAEIKRFGGFKIIKSSGHIIYLEYVEDFMRLKQLKSVRRVYLVARDEKYNPAYISRHKSLVGNIVSKILARQKGDFKSFKVSCAGSDTSTIKGIKEYIESTFRLSPKSDADLKINMIKFDDLWEIGVQISPRPLSVRDYRAINVPGSLDPTIAYALNSLCGLDKAESYLNIFSGSATLLIEAGLEYPHLHRVVGFDNDKKHLSWSIKNIRKAKLIKKIRLVESDIFSLPKLGKFDAITSDPPFGMLISKHENLAKLYTYLVRYSEETLKPQGILAIYTNRHELLNKAINNSDFIISKIVRSKVVTAVSSYLYPAIYICRLEEEEKSE